MQFSIYVDESSQECHRFMVQSATIVQTGETPIVEAAFAASRQANRLHPHEGEMKWEKVSRARLDAYKAVTSKFFEFNANDQLRWHCIIVDNTKLNHRKFNDGNPDVGFSKYIYQLLVAIARKFEQFAPGEMRYYVSLDKRCSSQSPEELKAIVSAGLRAHKGITYRPFRRIVNADSKKTPLLQMNDVLLGAISSHKNERHIDPGANGPKAQLLRHVAQEIGRENISAPTAVNALRFNVWQIQMQR